MQIPPIQPFSPNSVTGPASGIRPAGTADSVEKTFSQVLDTLNQSQNESDNLIQQLASGEDVDLHQVMIATEENDVNFRVAIAIRDRLVDAYREVMRMSV
ncbi:MAG: flagellar hook-basal body complex protein FliE [Chloroflexi bacterium]|nr:flagellar hook-basal body complex protein FliE [Chloroflexota bacterium]